MAALSASKGCVGDEILKRIWTLAFEPASACVQNPFVEAARETFFQHCSKVWQARRTR